MDQTVNERFILTQEYTSLIENLYAQIDCYKVDHEALKGELQLLINENKTLTKNYSELITTKIVNSSDNENELNLKNQIKILLQEKQSTFELWQNSLKIIDQLEEELLMFRGGTQNFINKTEIEKLNEAHSKEVNELQNKMQIFITELEDKKKLNIQSLEQKSNELHLSLRGHKAAMNQIKELEIEMGITKDKIRELVENINEKENIIKEKDSVIQKLQRLEYNSKIKVAEAINVAETAILEKNEAITKENQAKEEITQLTKTIKDIIKEAGEKVKSEVNDVKEECNNKIKEIYKDMKKIKNDLNDKNQQLEDEIKKRKNTEEELGKIKYGSNITEDEKNLKILHLERNLESTFQKLIFSERKLVQLTTERESLKIDLDQMCNNYGQSSKNSEQKQRDLIIEVKKLKNELYNSNTLLEKYEKDIKDLNMKAEFMEQELKNKINDQNRMFELLRENLVQVENENFIEKNELKKCWKTERALNKRWKSEVRDITNKLQNRIKELKSDNIRLKKHLQNIMNNENK